MWLVRRGIVLRNRLLFAAVEWVIANDGLDVGKFAEREFVGAVHEGVEVLEEEEGGGGVGEGLGKEGVVGAQEGDAV